MPTLSINPELLWKKVGYTPHEKQLLFHNSTARFKIPVCGRRFGKSRMAAAELLPYLLDLNYRGARFWIVGPTYDLAEKEFRYLWDDCMVKLGLRKQIKRAANNKRTGEMFIEMPWGTLVEVRSADHPEGLVGEGLAGVIMSEAAKQKKVAWEKYVRPALADYKGWAIFPSTPEGYNWYYDLYRQGIDDDFPDYEAWNFPSWENPYVYPEGETDPEIISQKRSEDDPWFWQEIGADFRSFVGKIYTEWKDETHILQRYDYNPDWDNYLFFDFGFANPFVALDVQIAPDDTMYIWREYYVPERPVYEHTHILSSRKSPDGYNIRCGFGDYADPGSVETLGRMLCQVFADPDSKDVIRGIQEVKKFLQVRSDGKPRLYVHKSCVNTIFEFQNYRMKQTIRSDENPKEDPKKWADHAMDAVRYGIMHLFVLGARYHLDDVREAPRGPATGDTAPLHVLNEELLTGESDGTYFRREPENVFVLGGGPSRW